MSPEAHLFLCYITDILDIAILVGCVYVLSINIKLYTEILKVKELGDKLDKKR